jgi:WD40 repeat protein
MAQNISNVAAQLNSSNWEQILTQCSANTQQDLIKGLSDFSGNADDVMGDPKKQFAMMVTMMADMQKKLRDTMNEVQVLKAAGVSGNDSKSAGRSKRTFVPKSKGKKGRATGTVNKRTTAELAGEDEKSHRAPTIQAERKGSYRFGSGKINYIKPSKGYPSALEAQEKPPGGLVLEYAHGYQGKEDYGRHNIFFGTDEKTGESAMIYHVAGVGVVSNSKGHTQRFFLEHNDDITCIALSSHKDRPTLVATGQTDPKDFGEKDMPKIYIWDWMTMRKIKLVKDAHWGMVLKVQFSNTNDYMYSIGGEQEHMLKVWDLGNLKRRSALKTLMSTPTCKEDIFGFVVCPYASTKFKEEFVIFGRKKAYHAGLQADKKGLSLKIKTIPFTLIKEVKANKKIEPRAILCADWLPGGKFIVGDNNGALFICEQTKPLVRIQAHSGILGAVLVTPENVVITGGNDGLLKTWTINDICTEMKQTFCTDKPITFYDNDFEFLPRAMAYDKNTSTVIVGSKTCQIMSWNLKSGKSQILIDGHDDQVWGLTTCNKEGYDHYYITGGYDGVLKMWDCKAREIIDTYEFEVDGDLKKQIVQCIWSNDGMLVAAGSEDGHVYLFTWFDNKDQELVLVAEYEVPVKKGREPEGVSYMRFNEDDSVLAVAHMDSNLYLFTIVGGGMSPRSPRGHLRKRSDSRYLDQKALEAGPTYKLEPWKPATHRAAPTHIQWNANATMLKVLTRDYEVAHWRLDHASRSLKFYPHIPDPDDVKWAGDPLIAGWDVEGCYQAEWDGTDLNDVTLSEDGQFLAAGDDFGVVRLFKYPAVSNKPDAHRIYRGHSSFVVGVEFCRNNEYLITCGGNDMAIFQWRLEKY